MNKIEGLQSPNDYRISRLLLARTCAPDELDSPTVDATDKLLKGLEEFLDNFKETRTTIDDATTGLVNLSREYSWLMYTRHLFLSDWSVSYVLFMNDRIKYSLKQIPDLRVIECQLEVGYMGLKECHPYKVNSDIDVIRDLESSVEYMKIIALNDKITWLLCAFETLVHSILNQYPDIKFQDYVLL